tara:strand:- start:322 stop:549 length:228 start_codon:yes stop_codon:yes gene_type:complete
MNSLYTKYDLVESLKLSVGTIDNKMKDGSLEYYKFGKSVRFDDGQVERFIRNNYPKKYLASKITEKDADNLRKRI